MSKNKRSESVGKREFRACSYQDEVYGFLLKPYMFDTEILEDGALANSMHSVVSKH